MAKEPTINYWCDYCLEQEQSRESGDTVMVLVPEKGIQELELCDPHQTDLTYREVVDLAHHAGRDPERIEPPTRPARQRKPRSDRHPEREPEGGIPCRVPGCKSTKPLKNRDSFGVHLRMQHSLNLTSYESEYGPA